MSTGRVYFEWNQLLTYIGSEWFAAAWKKPIKWAVLQPGQRAAFLTKVRTAKAERKERGGLNPFFEKLFVENPPIRLVEDALGSGYVGLAYPCIRNCGSIVLFTNPVKGNALYGVTFNAQIQAEEATWVAELDLRVRSKPVARMDERVVRKYHKGQILKWVEDYLTNS